MKLIVCHIENFGKLHDETFYFQDGLNIINEKNGMGKTTLTAFIRVMFFGFANESKRSELENERKRYKPWQGGVYGGQLTFQARGKTYIIERTFGSKDKEDYFSLRDAVTNLESKDFTTHVGQELFQLDAESFNRTCFLGQNDCETEATDSIHAKLGNLSEHTDDMNRYEDVHKTLTDKINSMSPTRKTGSIYKKKQEISELQENIRGGAVLDQSIAELNRKRESEKQRTKELTEKQKTLQEAIQQLIAYKAVQSKKEKYQELKSQCIERQQAMEEAGAYFKGRIPTEEELTAWTGEAERLNGYSHSMEMLTLPKEVEEEGKELDAVFQDGIPDQRVLAEVREDINALSDLKLKMAAGGLSQEETLLLQRYEQELPDKQTTEAELSDVIQAWTKRTEKKNLLTTKKATLFTMQTALNSQAPEEPQAAPSYAVCWMLVGIGFLLGLFMKLLSVSWAAAGIVFGVALICAGLYCIWVKKQSRATQDAKASQAQNRETPELLALQEEISQDEAMIAETDKRLQAFLAANQIVCTEQNVQAELYGLQKKISEYKALREKQEAYRSLKLEEKYREKEQEVRSYLAIYLPEEALSPAHYLDNLQQLERQAECYQRYLEHNRQYKEAESAYTALQEQLREAICSLDLKPEEKLQEQLREIRFHLQQYENSRKELERAEMLKKEFEAANDVEAFLAVEMPEHTQSLEEMNQESSQLREDINRTWEQINGYSKQLDRLAEQREQVSEDEESLKLALEEETAMKHRYEVYKKTLEYLEQAKIGFTTKYMEPIMKGFRKYYRILTGRDADDYWMNANMELSVQEAGVQQDVHFLSEGYRNLTGICLRMAMVDAMYQEEKPFVIFDDPFVNLDDENLRGGLAFLREAAEDYQLIYFTCHESRSTSLGDSAQA